MVLKLKKRKVQLCSSTACEVYTCVEVSNELSWYGHDIIQHNYNWHDTVQYEHGDGPRCVLFKRHETSRYDYDTLI